MLFEIIDKTKRKIRLTEKQWSHISSPISLHAYMANNLEKIKETLINPNKIVNSANDNLKVSYYRYYKENKKYLKVVVKYLNGNGFVITSYFVKNII